MKCVLCQTGETKAGTTTLTLERGNTMLVVRQVPAEVCEQCGEAYVSARDTETVQALFETARENHVQFAVRAFAA